MAVRKQLICISTSLTRRTLLVSFYVIFFLLLLSACEGNNIAYNDVISELDDEYDPKLSKIKITIPSDQFYIGSRSDTIDVSGICSGQFSSGSKLTVVLQLADSLYQSQCLNGTFVKKIDVSLIEEGTYTLIAEVRGVADDDVAEDKITLIKDTVPPRLIDQRGVVFPTNKTYTVNEPLAFTFLFTEPIVFSSVERPSLQLELGSVGGTSSQVNAPFSSASEDRITFRYTIQESDNDNDGIRVLSVDINDVVISDLAGNQGVGNWGADGMLPAGLANVRIDTEKPYIESINALANSTYSEGEEIFLRATFSKDLVVNISSQSSGPRLFLKIGDVENRVANYFESSNRTMIFRYRVINGDQDANGIDVFRFDPNLTFITDSAGNSLSTNLPSNSLVNLPNVIVDGTLPEITDLSVDRLQAKSGDTINFLVTFSEQTTITGTPQLHFVFDGDASTDGDRFATYDGTVGIAVGNGKYQYRFGYTLVDGEQTRRVKTRSTLIKNINGSRISDTRNDAKLTFDSKIFEVDYDAKKPTLQAIDVPDNGYYNQGDTLSFSMRFDELVKFDVTQDTYLELIIGTTNVRAMLDDSTLNKSTLTYSYIVEDRQLDRDGVTIGNLVSISSTGLLTDTLGNRVSFDIPDDLRPDLSKIIVDDVAPKVELLTRPAAATYSLREGFNELRFTYRFDEEVAYQDNSLTSEIFLPLNIGGRLVKATYSGEVGNFSKIHDFVYSLDNDLLDTDGVETQQLWFDISTTTDRFVDRADNEAIATPASTSSQSNSMPLVLVDSTIPKVTSLEFYQMDQIASTLVNSNLQLALIFDETVDVNQITRIPVRIGANSVISDAFIDYFVYTDSTGDAKRKVFNYNVQAGRNDNDGVLLGKSSDDVSIEFLEGGYIRDNQHNNFSGDLNKLPSHLLMVTLDTSRPYIERIGVASDLKTYQVNEDIEFQVTFNENLIFFDDSSDATVRLPLLIGDTTYYADYKRFGANNRSLIFSFTVPPKLTTSDISVDAKELSATTTQDKFTDQALNEALLTITDSVSISFDGLSIDSTPPSIEKITSLPGYFSVDETIDLYVDFDKNIVVTGTSSGVLAAIDFRIEDYSNANVRSFTFVKAINNTRLHFRYKVATGEDANGLVFGTTSGSSGSIRLDDDIAITGISGQLVNLELPTAQLADVIIDTTAPVVSAFVFPTKRTYGANELIDVFTTFSEEVNYYEGIFIADNNIGISIKVDQKNRYFQFNDLGNNRKSYKFTYRVQDDEQDENISSFTLNPLDSVNSQLDDYFVDRAGNRLSASFTEIITGEPLAIDSAGPKVTSVIAPLSGLYLLDDEIKLQIVFNEKIQVKGSDLRIAFRMAGASGNDVIRYFDYSNDIPRTNQLIFTYKVASGDQDYNGILLGETTNDKPHIDATGDSSIVDINDLVANYDLSIDTSQIDVSIDARVAEITSIEGPSVGAYGLDDSLRFTFTFSEDVAYQSSANETSSGFTLTMGDTTAELIYNDEAILQPNQLDFVFSVPQGVAASGIGLSYQRPTTNIGRIHDLANIDASIDISNFLPLLNLGGISIDTRSPQIIGATLSDSDSSSSNVLFGERVILTLTFDEQIVVTGNDLSIDLLVGDNGTSSEAREKLSFVSSTNTTISFAYSPELGEFDKTDGVRLVVNSQGKVNLDLGDASIKDVAGNNAVLIFTPPLEVITIDTDQTVISKVTLPAPGWYSDKLDFVVEFSDSVQLSDDSALLNLVIELEPGLRRRAVQVQKVSSDTYTLSYQIENGDYDNNGLALVSPLEINPVDANFTDSRNAKVNRIFNSSIYDLSKVYLGKVPAIVTSVDASFIDDESSNIYTSTENLWIRLNFNVPVTVGGSPRIPFTLGDQTRYFVYDSSNDLSNDREVIFNYQIRVGDEDIDRLTLDSESVDLNSGKITSFSGSEADNNFSSANGIAKLLTKLPAIDIKSPVITSIGATPDEYIVGETISFDVNFSENVILKGVGTLKMTVMIGSESKQINAQSGSGTSKIKFDYLVVNGDLDSDGVTIDKLELVDATLKDERGNDADLDLATITNKLSAVTVDTDSTGPKIVSISADDGSYTLDETFDIRVTFDETVDLKSQPLPIMFIDVGVIKRFAEYKRGDGSRLLTFEYKVKESDYDIDGITISSIVGTLEDESGNISQLDLSAVNAQTGVIIDTLVASVDSVSAAPAIYTTGNQIDISVTFDETVDLSGYVKLKLTVGADDTSADYISGSGTKTLVFRYIVKSDDEDLDGIDVTDITLNGGSLIDKLGNPANLIVPTAKQNQDGVYISIQPQIVSASLQSAIGAYSKASSTPSVLIIRLGLSKPIKVSGVSNNANPFFTVEFDTKDGTTATHNLEYSGGNLDSTSNLEFSLQISDLSDDIEDYDGIEVTSSSLMVPAGVTLANTVGTTLTTTLTTTVKEAIAGLDADIDTSKASIEEVTASIGNYAAGQNIKFNVIFDETVDVSGAPKLELTVGTTDTSADYTSGSGTRTLVFSYTVQSGDEDLDGIASTAITLNGAGIADLADNQADLSIAASEQTNTGVNISVQPQIVSASLQSTIGAYSKASSTPSVLTIRLGLSKPIKVSGVSNSANPFFTVEFDTKDGTTAAHNLEYSGGNLDSTSNLEFSLQISDLSDDIEDYDGIEVTSSSLMVPAGVTLANAVGTTLTTTLTTTVKEAIAGLDADIDTSKASIEEVTASIGNYAAGQNIKFNVIFDETVDVSGAPKLELTVGTTDTSADYTSGSGTRTLVFSYTVQSGDEDLDGIASTAITLNGAGIADLADNQADLSIATSEQTNVGVNISVQPQIVSASLQSAAGAYSKASSTPSTLTIRLGLSKPIKVSGVSTSIKPSFTVRLDKKNSTTTTQILEYSGGNDNSVNYLDFDLSIAVLGDEVQDFDGIEVISSSLIVPAGVILANTVGTALTTTLTTTVKEAIANLATDIDTSFPRVERVQASLGNYVAGQTINFNVTFDETVDVSGAPKLELTVGTTDTSADYTSGSGTRTLVFSYTVQNGDEDLDGIASTAITLNGARIADLADNQADLSIAASEQTNTGVNISVQPQIVSASLQSVVGAYSKVGSTLSTLIIRLGLSKPINVGGVNNSVKPSFAVNLDKKDGTVATYDFEYSGTNVNSISTLDFSLQMSDLSDDIEDYDGIEVSSSGIQIPAGVTLANSAGTDLTTSLTSSIKTIIENFDVDIDTSKANIEKVSATSGNYATGQTINFDVDFDETVDVSGTPKLKLTVGSTVTSADYASGTGTRTLVFSYTVQSGDEDLDGIISTVIELNGASIEDLADNDANLSIADSEQSNAGVNVSIQPQIASASLQSAIGAYSKAGSTASTLTIGLSLSRPIKVSGVSSSAKPSFTVTLDKKDGTVTTHKLEYAGSNINSTSSMDFTLPIVDLSDDIEDYDGIEVTSSRLSLPTEVTLANSVGTTLDTTINTSVKNDIEALNISIDTRSPLLQDITADSKNYQSGQTIKINLTFDETIDVGGTPKLELKIGATDASANYSSGSGTKTLTFDYLVQANDTDDDGIDIRLISLDSGSLADAFDNGISLNIPAVLVNLSGVLVNLNITTFPSSTVQVSYGDDPYSANSASCDNGETPTYSVSSTEQDVRVNVRGVVTIIQVGDGSATITATCPDDPVSGIFSSSSSYSLSIRNADFQLSFAKPNINLFYDRATSDGQNYRVSGLKLTDTLVDLRERGSFIFTSDNPSLISVDTTTGELTITDTSTTANVGSSVNIHVSYQGTTLQSNYNDTSADYRVTLINPLVGVAASYSLRKLRATYNGEVIQVRRSVDDATMDIGFIEGDLDSQSLTNFVDSFSQPSISDIEGAQRIYSLRKIGTGYSGSALRARVIDAQQDVGFTSNGNLDVDELKRFQIAESPKLIMSNSPSIVYSLRKVNSSYIGSAIQVRNDSDVTVDIGFDASGDLDQNAIRNHIGTGDGFVAIWYDQSGNNHAIQGDAENQPRIAEFGEVLTNNSGSPEIRFDGSNDFMEAMLSPSIKGVNVGFYMVISRLGTEFTWGGYLSVYNSQQSSDFTNTESLVIMSRKKDTSSINSFSNGASIDIADIAGDGKDHLVTYIAQDRKISYFLDNENKGNRSANLTGDLSSDVLVMGARYNDDNYNKHLSMGFSELIAYSNDTSSIRSLIGANQSNYWFGTNLPELVPVRVATWYDQSSSANHATQIDAEKQPIIINANGTVVSISNNKPAIRFNGNEYLEFESNTVLEGNAYSIFAVADADSGTVTGNYLLGTEGEGTNRGLYIGDSSSDSAIFSHTGNNLTVSVPAQELARSQVYVAIHGNNGKFLKLGDAQVTNNNTENLTNTVSGWIGAATNITPRFRGEIGEVFIYNTDERAKVVTIENNIRDYFHLIDLHVTTWYDQSNNAIDLTQIVNSKQPRVVLNGNLVVENGLPAIDFISGSNQFLASSNSIVSSGSNTATVSDVYISLVHKQQSTAVDNPVVFNLAYQASIDAAENISARIGSSDNRIYWDGGSSIIPDRMQSPENTIYRDTSQAYQYTFIKSLTNNIKRIGRGTFAADTTLATGGIDPSETQMPLAGRLSLSTLDGSSNFADMRIQEFIVFVTDKNADIDLLTEEQRLLLAP